MLSARPEFSSFSLLPAELQSKIWKAAYPRPGIHIFDVCFDSVRGAARSKRAFQNPEGTIKDEARWNKYKETVFLDSLEVDAVHQEDHRTPGFRLDPSMYRFASTLRETCYDSSYETRLGSLQISALDRDDDGKTNINAVYLPGKGHWIHYDNVNDVLCLRFGSPGSISRIANEILLGEDRGFDSGIADALDGTWSDELATTLRRARRIALDVSETWAAEHVQEVFIEEISYLSCVLQKNLEVLYLVDYCSGRCRSLNKGALKTPEEDKMIHGTSFVTQGQGEVIHGVGKTYTEVLNLEQHGWHEDHPARIVANLLDETIRSQQGMDETFRGVKVLVCEDDRIGGFDSPLTMKCRHDTP